VPADAAAAAHGTPGSAAGCAFGVGLGFGVVGFGFVVVLGAGDDVVGAGVVVTGSVLVAGEACEVAPAAASPLPPAGAAPPPEHAVSTSAAESAATPAKIFFTTETPELVFLLTPVKTGGPLGGLHWKVTIG